jgi:type III secretory pathway component EscS
MILHHGAGGGTREFLATVLLATPSFFALGFAVALSRAEQYPLSALWFVYEVSRNVGFLGVAVGTIITFVAAMRRRIPESTLGLMASAVVTAIILLWCAARILPSGW